MNQSEQGTAAGGGSVADDVADVVFGDMAPGDVAVADPPTQRRNLDMLYDIPLQVSVQLGETRLTLRELLSIGPGAIVELDRQAGESIDLLVNGVLVGRGDAVVVNDNFGLRITEILSREECLRRL